VWGKGAEGAGVDYVSLPPSVSHTHTYTHARAHTQPHTIAGQQQPLTAASYVCSNASPPSCGCLFTSTSGPACRISFGDPRHLFLSLSIPLSFSLCPVVEERQQQRGHDGEQGATRREPQRLAEEELAADCHDCLGAARYVEVPEHIIMHAERKSSIAVILVPACRLACCQ